MGEEKVYLDEVNLSRMLGKIDAEITKRTATVSGVSLNLDDQSGEVFITWCDPSFDSWESTKVVKKLNAPPSSESDGTVVVNNTTLNAYCNNSYIDTIPLDYGNKWYYAFFVKSTDGRQCNVQIESLLVGFRFVSFASGTDEEVAAMIKAHHNGYINVRDYWSVGEEHTDVNGVKYIIADKSDHYLLGDSEESTRNYGALVLLVDKPYSSVLNVQTTGNVNVRYKVNNYVSYYAYFVYPTSAQTLYDLGTNTVMADLSNVMKGVIRDFKHNERRSDSLINRQAAYKTNYGLDIDVTVGGISSAEFTRKIVPLSLENLGLSASGCPESDSIFSLFSTVANRTRLLGTDGINVRNIYTPSNLPLIVKGNFCCTDASNPNTSKSVSLKDGNNQSITNYTYVYSQSSGYTSTATGTLTLTNININGAYVNSSGSVAEDTVKTTSRPTYYYVVV